VTVLDPACGSGNFLYVAINLLLDLEKVVIAYAANRDASVTPHVSPTQLAGIEINPYAQQLAQVVIWIGQLQWKHQNGFAPPRNPVLQPIENIRLMDAILDLTDAEHPKEPEWPKAEFVVGNPPFLGGKKMRTELGDEYMDNLFPIWRERVRPEADLCCYWFEKARRHIEEGKCKRTGLLATQGIRGGANRDVLKRIKDSGEIFFAESDRPWILDGANVHVSMVGFDDGNESLRILDGGPVPQINSNLTATADITASVRSSENLNIAFMGDTKGGPFDISEAQAMEILAIPNPNQRPSSDVLVPWVNGSDVTRRSRNMWIIDFDVARGLEQASIYEAPFGYVKDHLQETRGASRTTIQSWWLHERPRVEMRVAIKALPRFLCTPRVSKHRLFVWLRSPTLPDCQLFAFARSDDFFCGVVHSRVHEVWARSQGTQVRERESGFRYTPTTCFETYPFPRATDKQEVAIAEAAEELDRLRSNWLNPPEWTREEVLEFPGSVDGPWARYVHNPDSRGIGTVRYPRLVGNDEATASALAARTLTNLYNERPTWLDLAHRKLDDAVFAAYGWERGLTDEEILAKLLELNLRQGGTG
jgi:type II restriction/modification system DNA methylase subunit YeeA